MSLVLEFDAAGAPVVRGEAPSRPAPIPAKPSNGGSGDVRKKTVPVIKPPAGPSATEWEEGVYVSLQQWLDGERDGRAVLLQPADDTYKLRGTFEGLALIAVDFPRIGDGRGYSHAALLRQRLGYKGPLRALGAVTADQVFAMASVGFDSIVLRADQSAETALAALRTFSARYHSSPAYQGALADRAEANFAARVRLLEQSLTQIAARHQRPALASSLSVEDMVITDVIARLKLPIDIFTLDTGRLHPETVALIDETKARYRVDLGVFRPDEGAVANYVGAHGRDGFYESVENRKLCCHIRKVEPLKRALAGRDAWVTGQRREQAATRTHLPEAEHDAERNMEKYNPLADWSWADILTYVDRYKTPHSPLYARGYVSIGCDPCTRALRPGEDPRDARWWWESSDSKECGLHVSPVSETATA